MATALSIDPGPHGNTVPPSAMTSDELFTALALDLLTLDRQAAARQNLRAGRGHQTARPAGRRGGPSRQKVTAGSRAQDVGGCRRRRSRTDGHRGTVAPVRRSMRGFLAVPGNGAQRPRRGERGRGSARERLLDAALEVLPARSATGATIAEIDAARGLTPGNLAAFTARFPTRPRRSRRSGTRGHPGVRRLARLSGARQGGSRPRPRDVTFVSFAIIRRSRSLFRPHDEQGRPGAEVRTAIEGGGR